jgi:sec-independent protein translocase protein TatA
LNLPGGWELVLVLLVVMLLFGSKRLPDSARALGRSLRILKAETKGLRDDPEVIEGETARFDPYTGKPLDETAEKPKDA